MMRLRIVLLAAVWLLLGMIGTEPNRSWVLAPPAAQAEDISYVYDAGRLKATISPTETAIWHYDAVGNLLSITRQSSALLSLISFTPTQGPVGTQVTIDATGISGAVTVAFNGVAAPVLSVSATQIVTQVPSGASTGPITITMPTGSATSSTPFTVIAGSGASSAAPTISGFAPVLGVAGTAVTITGSNFAPALADNRPAFNGTYATATSATSTSLGTTVPANTSSGRLSVATRAGPAVSSQDFFVVPSPYTSTDVEVTTRMTVGQSHTVTLNTANKLALIVFDGVQGQRVSLAATTTTTGSTTLSRYNPNGTYFAEVSYNWAGAGTAFAEPQVLPATGTYTILLRRTAPGSVTLALYDMPPDVSGTVIPGGPAVTVTTTTPGQNARLTFSGSAGQRVSIQFSNATLGSCLRLAVLNPNGTTLTNFPCPASFIDPITLPAAGVYTLVVNPDWIYTGSATFRLYDVPPDVTGSITPGGPPVTVTITTPGQDARLTFPNTAGQRVALFVNSSTLTGHCHLSPLTLQKPDGSTATTYACPGYFLDATTIAVAGTSTLWLNPSAATGQVTLTLYDVPPDVSGTLTPGTPTTVMLTTPGQNAGLTFTATAGQRASMRVTSSTITSSFVSILQPNGSSVGHTTTGFLDAMTLPVAGTYTLKINPTNAYTGQMTLTLYVFDDLIGSLTINGPATPVTITIPGQRGLLTFAGTTGQQITVRMTGNTIGRTGLTLRKPDNNLMISSSPDSSSYTLPTQTLPVTGTYTVEVDPVALNTGSLNVSVTSP